MHKDYKKTDRAAINNIIKAYIHIAKNLDLGDRINTAVERESFVTLKAINITLKLSYLR